MDESSLAGTAPGTGHEGAGDPDEAETTAPVKGHKRATDYDKEEPAATGKGMRGRPDQAEKESTEQWKVREGASGNKEKETAANGSGENQIVHTRSVSIKSVLKGQPRQIPVTNDEISEDDQVDKAIPPEPGKIEVTKK